jgi:hypothetical protein
MGFRNYQIHTIMDIAYLIALMPYRQHYEYWLPETPNTQCALTIPLQKELTTIITQTRVETMTYTMSSILFLFMLILLIQEKCL